MSNSDINNYTNNLLNLSSDLHRIALALAENSLTTAKVFEVQARKLEQSLSSATNPFYLTKLLKGIRKTLDNSEPVQKADDCLMYSTLLQNYILKNPLDNKNQPS